MATQRQDGWATDCKESAADLRGKEFYFASRDSNGKFILGTSGGVIAGVISEGRNTGKHTSINTGGQLKVVAGGSIAVGDNVQSDGNGAAITGSTNAFGKAISAASAGEMVEISADRV